MRVSAICLAGAVFASAFAASADPFMPPHRKDGLWQQTMSRDGKPMPQASLAICLDDAVQSRISLFGQQMSDKMCHSQKVAHNMDGSWSTDSTCTIGNGMTSKGRTVVTGNFSSKIVIATNTETAGAPLAQLNGKHETVITQVWSGPCKPGQRGGDVIMANGMKLNMLDMENAMHSPPSPGH